MANSTFAQPIYFPKFRAFDATGLPLNGGKLFSFIAGTVTPLATYPTYADAIAGTNANANPLILAADGSADAYGYATPYKFILQDSAGNVQWTEDNVYVGMDVPRTLTTVTKNGSQANFIVATKIATWTVESDALSEWSAANNRWICTYPGKYEFFASCEMLSTNISVVQQLSIYKNGAQVGRSTNRTPATASQIVTAHAHYASSSVIAGDFFEVFLQGDNVTTVQGGVGTRFTAVGLGA
jgi:hypothetical protein